MTPAEQEKFVKDFYAYIASDGDSGVFHDFITRLFILSKKENSLTEIKVLTKILRTCVDYAFDDSRTYEFGILENLYNELHKILTTESWGAKTIEFSNDINTRMKLIL